jgi:hypothetical protein
MAVSARVAYVVRHGRTELNVAGCLPPAEGLTKQEIIRCLKRYVARELFPHVQRVIPPTALEPPTNTQRAA